MNGKNDVALILAVEFNSEENSSLSPLEKKISINSKKIVKK